MEPEERDRLTRVETKVDNIEEELRTLKADVREIKSLLTEARGGWRMLLLVGGAGAALGGLVLKLVDWMRL
ncbi:hypothetical protein [Zavarzinia aquatilis]|uniref:hypothetical protein n=1 Tax=Zavarzinia aquatilis TaxID=2211142 RepID=UPI0014020D3B|nr:hypothetical protein [Zavarzinia aquatilis]